MNDALTTYKKDLLKNEADLDKIIKEIQPLQEKKNVLEEKIKLIERLIVLEGNTTLKAISIDSDETKLPAIETTITGRLSEMEPTDAFKELIKTDFRGKVFHVPEVLELATKEGLRTRTGNNVAGSYSRSIIARLLGSGFIKKVKRGFYRYIEQNQEGSIKEKEEIRKIRFRKFD